jgi:DDE superfamily endonuclease
MESRRCSWVRPLLASLTAPLAAFESCYTVPAFRTFCGLMAGLVAQTGRSTVCGMLVGAGLSRVWSHDRAHRFFSPARWSSERLGVTLARLICRSPRSPAQQTTPGPAAPQSPPARPRSPTSWAASHSANSRHYGQPDHAYRTQDDHPSPLPRRTPPPPWSTGPAGHPPRSASAPRPAPAQPAAVPAARPSRLPARPTHPSSQQSQVPLQSQESHR